MLQKKIIRDHEREREKETNLVLKYDERKNKELKERKEILMNKRNDNNLNIGNMQIKNNTTSIANNNSIKNNEIESEFQSFGNIVNNINAQPNEKNNIKYNEDEEFLRQKQLLMNELHNWNYKEEKGKRKWKWSQWV